MRFGTPTTFQPSLTPGSLEAFAPAVPTSEAGRKAAVLQSLSVLGAADPVGTPQDLQAGSYVADLEAHGVRFFADVRSKEAARQHLQHLQRKQQDAQADKGGGEGDKEPVAVSDAEESVRKVIFEQAVLGEREKTAFATAPVGIARAWHLRAETWTKKDVDKFESKLASLVGKAGKAGQGGSGMRVKSAV